MGKREFLTAEQDAVGSDVLIGDAVGSDVLTGDAVGSDVLTGDAVGSDAPAEIILPETGHGVNSSRQDDFCRCCCRNSVMWELFIL